MIGLRDAGALVVGSGLAGLAAALELARTMPVTLLTKTAGLAGGSSPLAQGGVAAALGPDDDPGRHAADTVAAGGGLPADLRHRDLLALGRQGDRPAHAATPSSAAWVK